MNAGLGLPEKKKLTDNAGALSLTIGDSQNIINRPRFCA